MQGPNIKFGVHLESNQHKQLGVDSVGGALTLTKASLNSHLQELLQ